MAENEVDIVIRTRAELQGARELKKELEQQVGRAKALGENYSDLTQKLHKVSQALSLAVPEFGKLTTMASRGGAIGALGTVLLSVARAAIEAKNTVLAFGQVQEDAGFSATLRAKESLDDYTKSIKRMDAAAADAIAKLQGLATAMEAVNAAEERKAEAQQERDLAEIDAMVAAGGISKEAGEVRKAGVRANVLRAGATRQMEMLNFQESVGGGVANAAVFAAMVKRGEMQRFMAERGLTEADTPEKLGRLVEQDRTSLTEAVKQRAEIRERLSNIGLFTTQSEMNQARRDKPVADSLDQSIPGLRQVLNQSIGRLADAQKLKEMRDKLDELEGKATTARTSFATQQEVIRAQRGAIAPVLGNRVAAIGLTTGAGIIEEARRQESKQAEDAVKYGFHRVASGLDTQNALIIELLKSLDIKIEAQNKRLQNQTIPGN